MPSDGAFRFGPYRLDPRGRRLFRRGVPIDLKAQQFDLLHALVRRAGQLLTKDDLIADAWQGVIVSDNGLTQGVSRLRGMPEAPELRTFIKTVPKHGYRFVETVSHDGDAPQDSSRDDTLELHIALIDGRAALGSLNRAEVSRGRGIFEDLVTRDDRNPTHHVGLANACVLHYEAIRSEASPDRDSLERAVLHAREAVRLSPALAEARITLGFILDRAGLRLEALASLQRGLDLEPDSWRHQVRMAAVAWGDDRLRAARRALDLWPQLALAHWLAASVFIARDALWLAEREIDLALAAVAESSSSALRFSTVALWWLKGLLCLARGAEDEAMAAFEKELAQEVLGHIYSRECCAQVWYAKAVCALRRGDTQAARFACGEALARVPRHPMVLVVLAILDGRLTPFTWPGPGPAPIDVVQAQAALLKAGGHVTDAAALLVQGLNHTPPGNGGWLIPIDPLLSVQQDKAPLAEALMTLRTRAGTWVAAG